METPPDEKKLRTAPFAAHAARGIIRDPKVRRRMMFALLGIAVLMVVVGSTALRDVLNPREHLGRFAAFWLACAWLTITSLLLALFDMLMVRAERRAVERALREQIARSASE